MNVKRGLCNIEKFLTGKFQSRAKKRLPPRLAILWLKKKRDRDRAKSGYRLWNP